MKYNSYFNTRLKILFIIVICFSVSYSQLLYANAISVKHVSFSVNGQAFKRNIASIFVLPNMPVHIENKEKKFVKFVVSSPDINFIKGKAENWYFKAPETPGTYRVNIEAPILSKQIQLNIFVLVPFDEIKNKKLNGYLIGEYPRNAYRALASYLPPQGFIQVNKADLNVNVSPHFTLKQFLCKQKSGYPKFVVIRPSTLNMLEDFIDFLAKKGIEVETFGVISAYRTPYYNKAIRNVPSSRHVYGDAMDLYIDRDGNGRLDDLNNDNKQNRKDVIALYNLAVKFQESSRGVYVGGIGKYPAKPHHGGFVHMDNRGYKARW